MTAAAGRGGGGRRGREVAPTLLLRATPARQCQERKKRTNLAYQTGSALDGAAVDACAAMPDEASTTHLPLFSSLLLVLC